MVCMVSGTMPPELATFSCQHADTPGMTPDDIHVELSHDNSTLTISGEPYNTVIMSQHQEPLAKNLSMRTLMCLASPCCLILHHAMGSLRWSIELTTAPCMTAAHAVCVQVRRSTR
jgi:hypothetical protein